MLKILLQTRFPPSVGGIETLALILCREWRELGCQVSVCTDIAKPEGETEKFLYPVYYQPKALELFRLWRKHDVVVLMNVSLKTMWPKMILGVPVVLTHHSPYWIDREGNRDWREILKVIISRRSNWNICVSDFVRDAIELPQSAVIPNCYDDSLFCNRVECLCERKREFVFVGRLVSDKGANLLLDAVARLEHRKSKSITIIGDGPERKNLEAQAIRLGLNCVKFTGALSPEKVVDELQRHHVMVVPSLCHEAFGIVALEGMACGCAVVVSDGGGLSQAVGSAGMVFKRGCVVDLAQCLKLLIQDDDKRGQYLKMVALHLPQHSARIMAERYLAIALEAVNTV